MVSAATDSADVDTSLANRRNRPVGKPARGREGARRQRSELGHQTPDPVTLIVINPNRMVMSCKVRAVSSRAFVPDLGR
jgi:hypothetical protein